MAIKPCQRSFVHVISALHAAIEVFYSSLTQQKQLDLILSERALGGERFVDGQTPLYGIFLRSTQRTTHSRGPSVSIALNTSSLQIQILTITFLSTITLVRTSAFL